MRPIIGNSVVIPHIIVKRVCIIGEVGGISGGVLRHLPVLAARTFVEELEVLIVVG